MATNDEGSGKGPSKGAAEQPGAKKPAAIIDLKPTVVGVDEPKKAADQAAAGAPVQAAAALPGKPDGKPQEPKPMAAASPSASVPPTGAAGASKPAVGVDAGKDKPGDKPGDKPAPKPTVGAGTASGTPPGKPAEQARPVAASVPPAGARGGGMWSTLTHLAAGLAGGLLVLLGADTLGPQLGLEPRRGGNVGQVSELEGRLAAVETATRSAAAALPADMARRLAAAEQRVVALEQVGTRLAEMDQRQTALIEGTKALEQRLEQSPSDQATARLAKLEDTLTTLARAAGEPQAGRIPQLAAITGRLTDLESTLSSQLAQLRKSVLTDVEGRVTAATEASEAARSGTVRIDRELAAQKSEATRMGQRIDGFSGKVEKVELAVRTAEETAAGLRSTLDALRAEVGQQLKGVARPGDVASAVEPVTGRLGKLEQSLQAVERSEEDRRSSVERIVLALELGNLKRVVERGVPFAAELTQVRRVAGPRVDLAALERYKDQGVATSTALHREFRDLLHRMIDADRAGDSAGIVDRLLAGAKSIVRVRKTDAAAEDTGVEATVARMEAALLQGRLADVSTLAAGLSEPARKIAAPWLDRVEASAAVERAIANVEGELKSSLGAAGKRG